VFVNVPTPHPRIPARLVAPEVLRTREHALTPFLSVIFTFGFAIESKELGGVSLALVEKNTLVPIEVIYSWNLSL
jgi:hypothetical protein